MSNRFTHIINCLKALGKIYPNKEMVKKMLNSLPKYWELKVTVIEESKDLNSLSLDELIGPLLTYEIMINHNTQEIKEALKKVGVAFKSTTCEKDEDSSNDNHEEDMAMKGALKQKKKAMMATWSDSDSSDSDEDNEEEEHCFKARKSKKNSWYFDSGCSRHMTDDKSHFMELMPKNGGEVTFGDNSKELIEGIGSRRTNASTLIKNVLYDNGLKHNLLSISQLCEKGFKVIFESNG
ncbi:Retrovirus-related Pol polyprotein from transposon TNT 1-94 [Gossypium australe]|uniref:Retrovirus-related Pol polyprotein from transposon TNT 1-94 n=1 Tax=Gossypium australe TaxID=47621 RepID=A0A5B6WEP7_9ROSI|nr:Retrovirus-related Pol polyprotein from transposon TNT 1-94 [Gossypium australe]